MNTLLTVVIPVHSIEQAQDQISQVLDQADALEWRLDYLSDRNIEQIENLIRHAPIPAVVTLRSQAQGGRFTGTESERLMWLKDIVVLQPDYLDIESDVADDFIAELHRLSPKTILIRSMHDFDHTPEDLDACFQRMQHPAISIYKLVTYANSSLDTLRMMLWLQSKSAEHQVIGHCMGEYGIPSRIMGAGGWQCLYLCSAR